MSPTERNGEPVSTTNDEPARHADSSVEVRLRRRVKGLEKELKHVRAQFQEAVLRLEAFRAAEINGVISVDAQGRIVAWNQAAMEIFGYCPEEALGRPLEEVLPHLPIPELAERAAEGWNGGNGVVWGQKTLEGLTGLRKGGGHVPLEVGFWGWREGTDQGVDLIVRDISERWVTRRALESMSQKHEALLATTQEGVVGLDAEGRTTYVNPAAERLLGWTARDLLGKPFHDLSHAGAEDFGGSEPRNCPVLESLGSGEMVRAEISFLRKDGSALPVSLCCLPVQSEANADGAVVLFQDITHRRKAEDALRASEARYRNLFLNAPIGMLRLDLEGRVQHANLALARILKYESPEEIKGKDFQADLGGDWTQIPQLWEASPAGVRLEPSELALRTAQGRDVSVRVGGVLSQGEDGGPEAVEMVLEDLSERRVLEEQLRQAQKMEAIGQLTAGIAHDFNNELSIIRMSADLLDGLVRESAPEAQEEVEAILRATHRAAEITRHLLGFSRQADLRFLPMDVGWLMENFSGILRVALPERIQVDIKTEDVDGMIRADPVAVEQILLNLVTNARDAMPEGGSLTLGASEVQVGPGNRFWEPEAEPGRYVCIFLADTGSGMDETTIARAFEPFFSTKAPGKGTGLGLSMVHGLMKQHGGFVDIRSELGGGTTVSLLFPRSGEEMPKMETLRKRWKAGGESRSIMVVEDEPAVRDLARRMLEREGFKVLTASHGMEALEVLEGYEEDPNLIISDLEMPEMGGLELFEALRRGGRRVPFILASGYQTVSGLQEISGGWREGLIHLQKPWTRGDILQAVESALSPGDHAVEEPDRGSRAG